MRTSILASVLAFTSSLVSAQFNITSKPFALVINSKNKTLDGTALFSCHEGAAIEALCIGKKLGTNDYQYNFNTSFYDTSNKPKTGYIAWVLKGGNFQLSQPLSISPTIFTNVAVPLFTPAEYGTLVQFDKKNKLNIPGYIDDTVSPVDLNAPKDYYRWYVCDTYVGYAYTTLSWAVGKAAPQNPSCQKVDVVRVFKKSY